MSKQFGTMSDIVTESPAVTCSSNDTISGVLALLQDSYIGCVILLEPDGGKVAGIFTERDYLMKIAGKGVDIYADSISGYMTPNPVCLTQSDDIAKAVIKMRFGKFRHMLVVDAEGKLKNVISLRDILFHIVDNCV